MPERVGQPGDAAPWIRPEISLDPRALLLRARDRCIEVGDDEIEVDGCPVTAVVPRGGARCRIRRSPGRPPEQVDGRRPPDQLDPGLVEPPSDLESQAPGVEHDRLFHVVDIDADVQSLDAARHAEDFAILGPMSKSRLEAFTDGVMAILITIMVLELHAPEGASVEALRPLAPVFMTYILSFLYLGIYWNNHHHMFQICDRINGKILWANLHLLFWLSLITFVTSWMGGSDFASLPTSVYGLVLLMAALSWTILQSQLIALHGPGSRLAAAVRGDAKGWISVAAYAVAIPVAFLRPWISCALYVLVALLWLIPDRRFESQLCTSTLDPGNSSS